MEFATNAILAALLTQASAFVKDLALPIQTPLDSSKVRALNFYVTDSREGPVLSCYLGYAGGYEFRHHDGGILSFDTLNAYSRMQDPREVVRILGEPHYSEAQCLVKARQAIRSLGYTNVALIDKQPRVRSPRYKKEGLGIPRFIFTWTRREPGYAQQLTDAEVEVNSSNLAIEDLSLSNPEFWRTPWPITFGTTNVYEEPDPTVPTRSDLQVRDVSRDYALAFIRAVLPEVSDFCRKLGPPMPTNIVESDIVMGGSAVHLKTGRLGAWLRLKSGYLVAFHAGHVVAVESRDVWRSRPDRRRGAKETPEYNGPISISKQDAARKVRQILIDRLGLPEKELFLDTEPIFAPDPLVVPTKGIRRYFFHWQKPETPEQRDQRILSNIFAPTTVSAEVDAVSGDIKALSFTAKCLERPDPKIDVSEKKEEKVNP